MRIIHHYHPSLHSHTPHQARLVLYQGAGDVFVASRRPRDWSMCPSRKEELGKWTMKKDTSDQSGLPLLPWRDNSRSSSKFQHAILQNLANLHGIIKHNEASSRSKQLSSSLQEWRVTVQNVCPDTNLLWVPHLLQRRQHRPSPSLRMFTRVHV